MLRHIVQRDKVGTRPETGERFVREDDDAAVLPRDATSIQVRGRSVDLAIGSLVALAAALAVWIEAPIAVRIPFGMALVLFLPGYMLIALLFPGRDGLDGVERLALGFGVSLGLVAPIALAIDYSPWKIETNTVVVSLLGIVLACAIAAAHRRSRLEPTRRLVVSFPRPRRPPLQGWDRTVWALVGFAGLAVTFLVVGAFAVVRDRLAGEAMTEFALYNDAGEARDYVRDVMVGESLQVHMSVTNREGHEVSYRIVVVGAGSAVEPPPTLTLGDGQTWTGEVRFRMAVAGAGQVVLFELWRNDRPAANTPYRLLRLIVDVDAGSAQVIALRHESGSRSEMRWWTRCRGVCDA